MYAFCIPPIELFPSRRPLWTAESDFSPKRVLCLLAFLSHEVPMSKYNKRDRKWQWRPRRAGKTEMNPV